MELKNSGILDKNKMQGIDGQIYEKADDGMDWSSVKTQALSYLTDSITRVINGEEHIIKLTDDELNMIWDEGDMLNTVNDVIHRLGGRENFAGDIERVAAENMDVIREIADKFRTERGMGDSYWYDMDEYIDERIKDFSRTADVEADSFDTHNKVGLPREEFDEMKKTLAEINSPLAEEEPNGEDENDGMDWSSVKTQALSYLTDSITRVINGEEHTIKLTEDELNMIWDEGDMLNTVNDVIHRLGGRENFAGDIEHVAAENMDVIREIADKFRTDRGMGDSYWDDMDEYIDERIKDLSRTADGEDEEDDYSPEM